MLVLCWQQLRRSEFLRYRQSSERQFNGGRRIGVKQIELIEQHLGEAVGVADVLAAGWEIFELIGDVAAACAEQSVDLYPAFLFARSAAVDGRNAIAFAPSVPAVGAALSGGAVLWTDDMSEVADALAGLASALSMRLQAMARLAADDRDRVACENAAHDADRISELLARSG
jgi:hypothetical protein